MIGKGHEVMFLRRRLGKGTFSLSEGVEGGMWGGCGICWWLGVLLFCGGGWGFLGFWVVGLLLGYFHLVIPNIFLNAAWAGLPFIPSPSLGLPRELQREKT